MFPKLILNFSQIWQICLSWKTRLWQLASWSKYTQFRTQKSCSKCEFSFKFSQDFLSKAWPTRKSSCIPHTVLAERGGGWAILTRRGSNILGVTYTDWQVTPPYCSGVPPTGTWDRTSDRTVGFCPVKTLPSRILQNAGGKNFPMDNHCTTRRPRFGTQNRSYALPFFSGGDGFWDCDPEFKTGENPMFHIFGRWGPVRTECSSVRVTVLCPRVEFVTVRLTVGINQTSWTTPASWREDYT